MSLTFQRESYSTIACEFPLLYKRHFDEIAHDKAAIPLAPDWDQYVALDRSGCLFVVTARDKDGVLVGYYFATVMRGLHNRLSTMAKTDMFYLLPEHRKGTNGFSLLRKVEALLWQAGADKIIIQTKLAHDCGTLFRRLGFEPIETVYTKVKED